MLRVRTIWTIWILRTINETRCSYMKWTLWSEKSEISIKGMQRVQNTHIKAICWRHAKKWREEKRKKKVLTEINQQIVLAEAAYIALIDVRAAYDRDRCRSRSRHRVAASSLATCPRVAGALEPASSRRSSATIRRKLSWHCEQRIQQRCHDLDPEVRTLSNQQENRLKSSDWVITCELWWYRERKPVSKIDTFIYSVKI